MNRKLNLINNILSMLITMALVFLVAYVCNTRYYGNYFQIIVFFVLGAILSGFICTFAHESGHVLIGKKNRFSFVSMSVWFFKWYRTKKKLRFSFVMLSDAGGYTEMVASDKDNIEKRFYKMTISGSLFVLIFMLIGIIPLIVKVPLMVYCLLSMFLPVGAYVFFGNILPMESYGVRNDGAVLLGLNKKDDESKVMISILKIQSDLFNGKTPSEIEEPLYFELPQIQEDSSNFVMLLLHRYNFYVDKGDYKNAKSVSDRIEILADNFGKGISCQLKLIPLYSYCTFAMDKDRADDLVYELEKYLNKTNGLETVLCKLVYNFYVKEEKDTFDVFYKKGMREVKRCRLAGYGEYYRKLFEKIKTDYEK